MAIVLLDNLRSLINVGLLAVPFVAGCSANDIARDFGKPIGIVQMSEDGSLKIRMHDAQSGAGTQIIRPNDEYYRDYVGIYGEIKPGESKSIFPSIGIVSMLSDGTIEYALHGIGKNEPLFMTVGQSRAGDPDYDSWISRVGGIRPGETKEVPPY
ncbi:hypothetical protein FHS96_005820 [Sphingomonas zeicaulis]|uniref:hypothetical protein n=1 Tax=Sphingomonas zeicaulis TaxID=1632740 RepID=UPI003D21E348